MRTLFSFILVGILASALSAFAQNRPLSELTAGDYPQLVNILGPITYRPEVLTKLARPTLIYADMEWFREKGYDVPLRITPTFAQELLNLVAFAKPLTGEPATAYDNSTVTFYSDFYGGDEEGMNGNQGSGRAAAKGEIQLKGPGPTSMVNRAKLDPDHSSGTMALFEGLMEVVGSHIAHQELPYGGNRVIALIATGTKTKDKEPRVLAVREDPLRPAHFIINETKSSLLRERKRLAYVMENVIEVLPLPTGAQPRSAEEKLKLGVEELIRRHARLAAYSYANHFFHAAYTPSNEVMDGGALDFAAFISLIGHPRAGRLEDNQFNGDLNAMDYTVRQIISSLRQKLPPKLGQQVIKVRDGVALMHDLFDTYLRYEMVAMTGAPPELMTSLRESAELRQLGETLVTMSYEGNRKRQDALGDHYIRRTDTYKLEIILPKMAAVVAAAIPGQNFSTVAAAMEEELGPQIPDDALRRRLAEQYLQFVASLAQTARAEGIEFAHLQKYLVLSSKIRNQITRPILANYELSQGIDWYDKMETFQKTQDPTALRRALRDAIRTSRRTYHDASPQTLVLSETIDPDGTPRRTVFDLRTGKTSEIRVEFAAPRGGGGSCREIFG